MPLQACTLSARTPATVRRPLSVMPLLLLLLFLCCVSVCVAWNNGGVQSTGVVRELPRKGQSGVQAYTVATEEKKKGWKLVRIVASTKDLENPSKYCTEVGQNIVSYAEDEAIACKDVDILSNEKKDEYIKTIIPAAIKLHSDRLRVQPQEGKIKVPEFVEGGSCAFFTVPGEHRSVGVDADFVLYVAANNGPSTGLICGRAEPSGRPIAGAINFIPHLHGGLRLNVRLAAREIGHALGFSISDMKKKGMLSGVTFRGKNRTVVSSKLTKEKAQKHYGCNELEGMELATENNPNWLVRVAKDELMAITEYSGAGYYTALTMALFEDLGYYRANWGMEEPMKWGKQSGCEFLKENCKKDNRLISPELFCEGNTFRCSSDRTAYGMCYRPTMWSGQTSDDVCHVIGSFTARDPKTEVNTYSYCTGTNTDVLPGSLMGSDSWCLDGDGLQVQKTGSATESVNGVCARVQCDDGSRTVKVQYKGNDKWHDCREGTSISVESSAFTNGKIKCPKYDEVCTIASNGGSLIPFVDKQPTTPSESTPAGSTSTGSSGDTTMEGVQFGKDGTLSAVCSLPIVFLLMVLSVALAC